jgi:Flp pilus assembly protein TadG
MARLRMISGTSKAKAPQELELPMKMPEVRTSEDGQTTVFAALTLVVVIAFVGLAVDVGGLWYAQHRLHAAAEAAALAGALEVETCLGAGTCSAMQTAVASALTENGLNVDTVLTNCASGNGSGLTLTINNPPCFKGTADPNNGKSQFVESVLSTKTPTHFMRILGFSSFPISARAEALRTGNPNCIYALDRSGGNAITVDALAVLSSTCGVVDESSASNAFSCNILAAVNVASLKISGGLQSFLCSSNPAPRTNSPLPVPSDPLAWLPKPSVTSCGSSLSSPYNGSPIPLLIVGPATLYPNQAYCGGIVLLPTANVTFMPGTYVIRSGGLLGLQGGMSIDLGAQVSGSGVTFYNYGPNGGVNFVASSLTSGKVSLTAPASGTYGGILFFQDSANTTPAVIIANSSWNTTLEGAFYFPAATVTTAATGSARYNILIAKDIAFTLLSLPLGSLGASTFANDYSSLANGSPLAGGGAALVQ